MELTELQIKQKFRSKTVVSIIVLMATILVVSFLKSVEYNSFKEPTYKEVTEVDKEGVTYNARQLVKPSNTLMMLMYFVITIGSFLYLIKVWYKFLRYVNYRKKGYYHI